MDGPRTGSGSPAGGAAMHDGLAAVGLFLPVRPVPTGSLRRASRAACRVHPLGAEHHTGGRRPSGWPQRRRRRRRRGGHERGGGGGGALVICRVGTIDTHLERTSTAREVSGPPGTLLRFFLAIHGTSAREKKTSTCTTRKAVGRLRNAVERQLPQCCCSITCSQTRHVGSMFDKVRNHTDVAVLVRYRRRRRTQRTKSRTGRRASSTAAASPATRPWAARWRRWRRTAAWASWANTSEAARPRIDRRMGLPSPGRWTGALACRMRSPEPLAGRSARTRTRPTRTPTRRTSAASVTTARRARPSGPSWARPCLTREEASTPLRPGDSKPSVLVKGLTKAALLIQQYS